MEIAFIRDTSSMSARDLAFQVAAVDKQLREHILPAWGTYWPAVAYDTLPDDALNYHLIAVMDDIRAANALGYHNDVAGFIYGRCLTPGNPLDATTLSHEAAEMTADPTCGEWHPMADGDSVALEIGDPVEGDSYTIEVSLGDETRKISVSNFVLPSWFDLNGTGPFDYMMRLDEPQTMSPGGYMIVRSPNGETTDVFASTDHEEAGHRSRLTMGFKRASPWSRASRRHAAR